MTRFNLSKAYTIPAELANNFAFECLAAERANRAKEAFAAFSRWQAGETRRRAYGVDNADLYRNNDDLRSEYWRAIRAYDETNDLIVRMVNDYYGY